MSHLLVKYKENQIAAQKLIDEHQLYAASVHCSYYSCVQLINYIFKYVPLSISAADITNELNGKDSHLALRSRLRKELKILDVPTVQINIIDGALEQLKLLRNKADYKDALVGDDESRRALSKSIQVIEILKNKFSLT